ncbi:hypothetical protein STIAU_6866 [Stigmatella aurantiaca DW4/3-1]|uniref:Uncharacterized protein n=1 Tax=Stigmatella aurantiaca (strain DW4/3-1) TaxID=378806 RepID=Q09AY2_STIAD|nr:hypothetical protein STIAU_6866 [Stigmatella aurantiaca DW4/3-1]
MAGGRRPPPGFPSPPNSNSVSHGQLQHHLCPLDPGRLHPDAASVPPCHLSDDRQPEPRSGRGTRQLAEGGKYRLFLIGRNAWALVRHADARASSLPPQTHVDLSPLWREFEGIGQQIVHRPPYPTRIEPDVLPPGRFQADDQPALLRLGASRLHGLSHHLGQIRLLPIPLPPPRGGQLQQLARKDGQPIHLTAGIAEKGAHLLGPPFAPQREIHPGPHEGERRAQLMSSVRDEPILLFPGTAQLVRDLGEHIPQLANLIRVPIRGGYLGEVSLAQERQVAGDGTQPGCHAPGEQCLEYQQRRPQERRHGEGPAVIAAHRAVHLRQRCGQTQRVQLALRRQNTHHRLAHARSIRQGVGRQLGRQLRIPRFQRSRDGRLLRQRRMMHQQPSVLAEKLPPWGERLYLLEERVHGHVQARPLFRAFKEADAEALHRGLGQQGLVQRGFQVVPEELPGNDERGERGQGRNQDAEQPQTPRERHGSRGSCSMSRV